ncbi:VWA domain-containing protein [bacterium]|nr:VWA domain-containing protein [bacterium]
MNKKLIIIGLLILAVSVIGKLIWCGLKSIKIDEFHPASVIFVIDSSASNQAKLNDEIKYLRSLCIVLDPEDKIKIIRVSEKSYLIYEGAPTDSTAINDTLKEFTKFDAKDYGTAYGEALKKAFDHALTMYKEGYIPSIVVIGDLENEGAIDKQIDWDTLPQNVENVKKYIPELSMMFAYAHPEKLDLVKTKLTNVLGENKLILVNEQTAAKSQRKLLEAIGR